MFLLCLVFAMFCARLFICASWSPAGKGLTSWLSFVVSSVSLSLSHWYPGSGVVLDCIDSWSLQSYLLLLNYTSTRSIYNTSTVHTIIFNLPVWMLMLCFSLCWRFFIRRIIMDNWQCATTWILPSQLWIRQLECHFKTTEDKPSLDTPYK